MYKYLASFFILALLVIGCTDESNMVGPVSNTVNNEMLNKQTRNYPKSVESVDLNNKSIINPSLIIFPDSTSKPGDVHPDSRWGFLN